MLFWRGEGPYWTGTAVEVETTEYIKIRDEIDRECVCFSAGAYTAT
jgi:hypothetical protein